MFVPRSWAEIYDEQDVRDAVAASHSFAEALRRLGLRSAGGNHRTIRKWCARWNISTEHFDTNFARQRAAQNRAKPLSEILVRGSSYHRGHLKRRLYEEGIKDRKCELCGQGEIWRGREMSLVLDHVNGRADDNRLENLRIVCANCAATLDTHCGRNLPRRRTCVRCGTAFQPTHLHHRYCSLSCGGGGDVRNEPRPALRKVARPPYPQLVDEVRALGYCAVGRKYGVSDTAIRKWLRQYERELGSEDAAERRAA
jgi:hypothetical protein